MLLLIFNGLNIIFTIYIYEKVLIIFRFSTYSFSLISYIIRNITYTIDQVSIFSFSHFIYFMLNFMSTMHTILILIKPSYDNGDDERNVNGIEKDRYILLLLQIVNFESRSCHSQSCCQRLNILIYVLRSIESSYSLLSQFMRHTHLPLQPTLALSTVYFC